MPKRRSMLIGMGALAMGSGAAFSSATFQNSAQAGADFRVVVEDGLVIEPGLAFRGGGGNFNPSGGADWAYDGGDGNLFENEENENLGGHIGADSGPRAASINDATNDDLVIEVATWLAENAGQELIFNNLLRVRNVGTTQRNVAIAFDEFGSDVGNTISSSDVRDIYSFEAGNYQISESEFDTAPNWLSLDAGDVRNIDLVVDTRDFYDEIVEIATGTNPFNDDVTTVDLLDTIEFGTEEDDPQDPGNV